MNCGLALRLVLMGEYFRFPAFIIQLIDCLLVSVTRTVVKQVVTLPVHYRVSSQTFQHTSSAKIPLAMFVANQFHRYRPRNLMLYGLTPGPFEWTCDELQPFEKDLVDDLIHLYEHGILVQTPLYPQGMLSSFCELPTCLTTTFRETCSCRIDCCVL
jgi:hypothetical protein